MSLEYPSGVVLGAIFLVLIVANRLYFKVARQAGIIDIPNQRSSHILPTIRGGGIVFVFALLLWSAFNLTRYPWFLAGALLIAGISFIDDIRSLPASIRFLAHLAGVLLLGIQVELFDQSIWIIFPVIVVSIGAINAFNFMDGINGITGVYGLVNVATFLFINDEVIHFIDESLLQFISLSILVFLFFNFRKQARCFAGDVGSVTLAYLQVFFLVQLILATQQFAWIFIFLVFGVDSVVTILYRLRKGENIFQAHRSHLYQYLSNEMGQSHLKISSLYGLVQLTVNGVLIIFLANNFIGPVVLLAAMIAAIYVVIREQVLRQLGLKGFLEGYKCSL